MPTVAYKDAQGKTLTFDIAGSTPTPEEERVIAGYLGFKQEPTSDAPAESGGLNALLHGASDFIDQFEGGIGLAGSLAAEKAGLEGLSQSFKDYADRQKEQLAESQRLAGERGYLGSVAHGIGYGAIPTIVGVGAGLLATPAAGLATRAALLGGATAGASAPGLFYNNVERQLEANGEVDYALAASATVPQALVESVSNVVLGGMAGLLKKPASALINEGIKRTAERYARKSLGEYILKGGKFAATGATSEALEEVAQQAIERWQAGLSITNEEALNEYVDAAKVAAGVGGILGGGFGAIGAARSQSEKRKLDQLIADLRTEKDDTASAIQATQREEDAIRGEFGFVTEGLGEVRRDLEGIPEELDVPAAVAGEPVNDNLADPDVTETAPVNDNAPASIEAANQNVSGKEGVATLMSEDIRSEELYTNTVEAMRDKPKFSPKTIRRELKVDKVTSEALFEQIKERGDSVRVGGPSNFHRIVSGAGSVASRRFDIEQTSDGYGIYEVESVTSPKGATRETRRVKIDEYATPNAARQKVSELDPNYSYMSQSKRRASEEVSREEAMTPEGDTFVKQQTQFGKVANQWFDEGMPNIDQFVEALVEKQKVNNLEADTKKVEKLVNEVLGPGRIEARAVPSIKNQSGTPARGSFTPNLKGKGLLQVARDLSSPNLSPDQRQEIIDGVTGHELIHALRAGDMIKQGEWTRLSRKANQMKVPGKRYTFLEWAAAKNDNLTRASDIQEEAVAEMAKHFKKNPEAFKPKERRTLGKIIKAIHDFFRGISDGEAVLSDIFEGKMKARKPGDGGMGPPTRIVEQPDLPYTQDPSPGIMYDSTADLGERVPEIRPDRLADLEAANRHTKLSKSIKKFFEWMPESWKNKSNETTDTLIIQFQDRLLSLAQIVDKIKDNDGVVATDKDPYVRATLLVGEIDEGLVNADRTLYQPLHDAIISLNVDGRETSQAREINEAARLIVDNYKDANTAISELYLIAQHAAERNAEMGRRNEPLKELRIDQHEMGSGMSTQDAGDILTWINSRPYADKLSSLDNPNSVRSRMRDLIAATNDVRLQGQLIPDYWSMTDEDGNPIPMYEDYVPLRGFVEEHVDPDETTDAFVAGKGFKIMGKEDMSATGRRSMASYVVANAVMQNQEAISRSYRNKVARSFVELIENNPNEFNGVAEVIEKLPQIPYYDTATGTVKMRTDMRQRIGRDIFVAKRDGQEVLVKIHDERLRKAMVDQPDLYKSQLGPFFGMLHQVNRVLAATRTSWNPEFLISNGLRDLETALINLGEVEGARVRTAIVADVMNAGRGVWRGKHKGEFSSEWAKEYQEFRARGGMTAFLGIRELEDTIIEINRKLSEMDGKGGLKNAKDAIFAVRDYIEDMNIVVENAIRLSTYKHLKNHFLSLTNDPSNIDNQNRAKDLAALHARKLTVDFNAGGEQKNALNALFLFYNASLQGTVALLTPLARSKNVRKLWMSVLAAGATMDMLNRLLSDEDDDGVLEYDKIPRYILENNIILMDPTGMSERGYIKIPMPYLMNAIFNTGRSTSRYINGGYNMGEYTASLGGTFIDTLNPIGGTNSWANFVMPTVLDPIVDLARNKDFADRPIYKPESPYSAANVVASQRYWNNTSPIAVDLANLLHEWSGGEGDYLGGAVEVNPDVIEYWWQFVTGGVGATAQRFYEAALPEVVGGRGSVQKMLSGEEVSLNDIPIVRRFAGNVTSREDMEAYLQNREKYERIRQTVRSVAKEGDMNGLLDLQQRYGSQYRLSIQLNKLETARRRLSRQINRIKDSNLPEDEKKARIDALRERQEAIVDHANDLVRETEAR